MRAKLVIPSSKGITYNYPLHVEYHEQQPVLVTSRGRTMDGPYFQLLRDRMGAWIETTESPVVAHLLGLPEDAAGLVPA
jgi:hypothetical protein